jgi:hypothetical protein
MPAVLLKTPKWAIVALDRMPSGECRLQKINLDAGFIVRLRGFDLRSLADVR